MATRVSVRVTSAVSRMRAAVNQCGLVKRFRRVSLVSRSFIISVFSLVSRDRNHETAPEAAAAALAGVSRHSDAEG